MLIDCASSLLKSPSPFQRNNKRHSYTTLEVQRRCTGPFIVVTHVRTHTHKLIRTTVRMHKYTDCVRVINYDIIISNTIASGIFLNPHSAGRAQKQFPPYRSPSLRLGGRCQHSTFLLASFFTGKLSVRVIQDSRLREWTTTSASRKHKEVIILPSRRRMLSRPSHRCHCRP